MTFITRSNKNISHLKNVSRTVHLFSAFIVRDFLCRQFFWRISLFVSVLIIILQNKGVWWMMRGIIVITMMQSNLLSSMSIMLCCMKIMVSHLLSIRWNVLKGIKNGWLKRNSQSFVNWTKIYMLNFQGCSCRQLRQSLIQNICLKNPYL